MQIRKLHMHLYCDEAMKLKLLFIIIATALLAGCETTPMNTPSGRAEITVPVQREKAKSVVLNYWTNKHYIVVEDSESVLTMEGDAGAWLSFWFSNTVTGETPRIRLRFALIELDHGTRIIAAPSFVYAPGLSGRSSEDEFSNPNIYAALQNDLNQMAMNSTGSSSVLDVAPSAFFAPATAK